MTSTVKINPMMKQARCFVFENGDTVEIWLPIAIWWMIDAKIALTNWCEGEEISWN
jgi:hypothetical protein